MNREDYTKVVDTVGTHKNDINDALGKSSHRYWKIEVLPDYDNKIGGYNLHATAVGVTGIDEFVDNIDIRSALKTVRALPFVSKAKQSNAYNKKMVSVIAIGLKIK
jgi:hypothetical protein